MKLAAQLISVTFFSIYLIDILKKKKEEERKETQERKYDGHLGGGPSFYLKIIALVRVQVYDKNFLEGRGGDTFKTPSPYEQLLPLPTPCFKMF